MKRPENSGVPAAVQAIRAGRMVVMTDDENREDEGDLVLAARFATQENINFMARRACGLICLSLPPEQIDRLSLPMMTPENKSAHETPFTISIEAAHGVTTGISAADRARTILIAISPEARPEDLVSPGHIFPLRAHEAGVLGRSGHTEGALDLARLAGVGEGAVICEIMAEDGTMMKGGQLTAYARKHDLPMISVRTLTAWIQKNGMTPFFTPLPWSRHSQSISESGAKNPEEPEIQRIPDAEATLPVCFSEHPFRVEVFRNKKGIEHLALIRGDLSSGAPPVVRLHSACLTGDALGSLRCDCGPQLHKALAVLGESECGILIYIRDHEGRGIGLGEKIRAYRLQEQGLDTVTANEVLGHHADARDYSDSCAILRLLGVKELTLLTNNPEKEKALLAADFKLAGVRPLATAPNPFNAGYLETKAKKMGHRLGKAASAS